MQIFYLPRDDIDRTMSVLETLYERVLQHENVFKGVVSRNAIELNLVNRIFFPG